MNCKRLVKDLLFEKNPLVRKRRDKMRRELTNQAPSLLVPNCLGGILFHDLGLQFCSPTVNLMMYQRDFVRMVCGLDGYLGRELSFFNHPEYDFPCAKLGDATIHFTHYHSEDEAREIWNRRKARLNRENLFVVVLERDGLTKVDILALGKVRAKGIVVFTAHDYPEIPYACHVPSLSRDGEVEGFLDQHLPDGHRNYEKVFDFVRWFNEADGGDYDVKRFCRK